MRLLTLIPAAIMLVASTAAGQSPVDTSSLVARLGVDTIAVERIVRTANTVEAEIAVRSPRTTLQRHKAQLGADGTLSTLEVTVLDPATGATVRRTAYTREADSIRIARRTGRQAYHSRCGDDCRGSAIHRSRSLAFRHRA